MMVSGSLVMERFSRIIEFVGGVMDGLGVLVLIVGALYSMLAFLVRKHVAADNPYNSCRKNMGKAILLGLELLVAADIIRTVVGRQQFRMCSRWGWWCSFGRFSASRSK